MGTPHAEAPEPASKASSARHAIKSRRSRRESLNSRGYPCSFAGNLRLKAFLKKSEYLVHGTLLLY
jgi:hypothetical protein